MADLIVAVYNTRTEAEEAVEKLVANDVKIEDISMVMSDETQNRDFAIEEKSKVAEGTAGGGAIGGALGALAAGLTSVAAITVPGVGVVAAGPITAALTGAGAGAAAGGGLGALVGAGIKEEKLAVYEKEIQEGGILVCVNNQPDRERLLEELLKDTGARELSHK